MANGDRGSNGLMGIAVVLILYGLGSALFGRGCYQSSPYHTGCNCNPLTWNACEQYQYNRGR